MKEKIDKIMEEIYPVMGTKTIRKILEKHLLTKEEGTIRENLTVESENEVCKACLGKKQHSVYKGDCVGSPDFYGDKAVLIKKGGIAMIDCKRCNGTGSEPENVEEVEPKDWIDNIIDLCMEFCNEDSFSYDDLRQAIANRIYKMILPN